MPHNELRKDFLLDRWVVIATERARRPTDFVKQKDQNPSTRKSICPLCLGNEHMTPPAVLVYKNVRGQIVKDKDQDGFRHKDWIIRCVPNLYPAFSPPRKESNKEEIMKNDAFGLAVGHHEVVIENPVHNMHPAEAELPQLVNIVNAYVDRIRELAKEPYVKYVSVFRNHGLQAGASLNHAHSQLIAMPFVPPMVAAEMEASAAFWRENCKCIFCDLAAREYTSPRFVTENADFVAVTPYASQNPMEFWIIPKKHAANPLDLTRSETESFVAMLGLTLRALKTLVNDPPYNYGIHLSIDKEAEDYYHWHLEVLPKLAIWAGFEKSTGVYINTIPPETAAAELIRVINRL